MEPVALGQPGKDPAHADRLRVFRIEFKGRDVVQPRPERQEKVLKARALSLFLELVQRNRLILGEWAGLDAPQMRDMSAGAERLRDVASEAPGIGALGDMRDEGDLIQARYGGACRSPALPNLRLVERKRARRNTSH